VKDARRKKPERLTIHIDGAGPGPDGGGSRVSRVVVGTSIARVKPVDAGTNNEAEYRALRWALLKMRRGGEADIFSDSLLIVNQFNGKWAVRDPKMKAQLDRIRTIISDRLLKIRLSWLPREENLAGRLL
jgi:ribonuclease HI